MSDPPDRPAALDAPEQLIAEPDYPGPFAVGRYARGFRDHIRKSPPVRLIGEVTNFRAGRGAGVYFELRDADGAVPCAIWRNVYDKLELPEGAFRDGVEVVVAGSADYFPGGSNSSPSFNFRVSHLRLAGEGDLLAQLVRLRKQLAAEGVFDTQKRLHRPVLPRTIGVVTGADSAARADLLAGLGRRGWNGTIVWAHPPVQGAAAAPKIAAALRGLAALAEVETIIVARGGGSLIDLWCFCDEALARTISLLRVPVIAGVGHETDYTLIDDVAAVSCSTPTHTPEAAVRVDLATVRRELIATSAGLGRAGRRSVSARAKVLATDVRALAHHTEAQRSRLHQLSRETRASSGRVLIVRRAKTGRRGLVLARRQEATQLELAGGQAGVRRGAARLREHSLTVPKLGAAGLERLAATLSAHDPERVLERGYAIVESEAGEVVTSAASARERRRLRVRFSDDHVAAEVIDDD